MQFENRHAVVTGGAKGIGEATTHAFLREGARVSILDIDEPGAQRIVAAHPGRATFFRCDVSRAADVEQAVRGAIAVYEEASFLVNSAGIQSYGTCAETSEADWDRTLNVNLKGAFLAARAVLPSMLRRGGGVVVNLASVQAFVSQNQVAAYTTSKTALLGLTRSIAVDYAPTVRCVAVCPGTVDTPMLRDAIALSPDPQAVLKECNDMHPVKRIGTPDEVAELILFLCGDKAGFITGQPIRIDGGLGLSIGGSKRD
jgi:NAD(P)-dependent dehydrogenase (short-subunit alcohol dehydrogenase family)